MDDLTTIKGVGDVMAKRLADAGITTFEQLRAVDPANPPFALTGKMDWPYLVAEAAEFVADNTPKEGEGPGAAVAADQDAAAKPGQNFEDTQERSGTAREAPSTDVGTPATPDVGGHPAAPSPKDEEPTGPSSITITGPRRGRWRAGRHFGPEPVTIALADLSDAELEALRGDPALTVVEG